MKARHRSFAWLGIAGLAAALFLAILSTTLVRTVVRERFVERAEAETALLGQWLEQHRDLDPQQFAEDAAAKLGMRLTLIDIAGNVRADSARDRVGVEAMENHLDRPELQAATLHGFGGSFRTSTTTHVEYFYSARLVVGDGPIRYLRVALPTSRIYSAQDRYSRRVALAALLAMALFSLVAYLAVRRISRPIEQLALEIERSGDSADRRIEFPPAAGQEIRRLTGAVRQVRQSLLARVEELDSERRVLSAVVSGMREGVLLVGPDRRVHLANPCLVRLFDLDFDPVGSLLPEVVRHPVLLRDVEDALTERREVLDTTVRLPGLDRSFELRATPLGVDDPQNPRGVLVLLFDTTRTEALERVRREFVANVSHELRTPLSSIKAFVENLIDDGLNDRQNSLRFLEIVRRNADYMESLVEDLTDLSMIETGAAALELRSVDAAEVAREVVERMRPAADGRQVRLTVTIDGPFPLRADRRRLEQMLANLVDNAIKFNRLRGEVRVGATRDGEWARLFVEDDGIGIPGDRREQVFHRFFQVDPQRSRDTSGTGLGLAIVKHLMRLHDGRISLESEVGRGSRFTLEFPLEKGPDLRVVPG